MLQKEKKSNIFVSIPLLSFITPNCPSQGSLKSESKLGIAEMISEAQEEHLYKEQEPPGQKDGKIKCNVRYSRQELETECWLK